MSKECKVEKHVQDALVRILEGYCPEEQSDIEDFRIIGTALGFTDEELDSNLGLGLEEDDDDDDNDDDGEEDVI